VAAFPLGTPASRSPRPGRRHWNEWLHIFSRAMVIALLCYCMVPEGILSFAVFDIFDRRGRSPSPHHTRLALRGR
jgi:hypothetical protein